MHLHSPDFRRCVAALLFVVAFLLGFASVASAQATTTAIGVSPATTVTYGTMQTFTATVASGPSAVTDGFVTFTDTSTNTALSAGLGLNANGQAAVNAVLRAGAHTIVATYTADPLHTGSFSNTNVTVNKAPLTVTARDTEIPYSVSPLFLASFAGFVNGDSVNSGAVSGTPAFTTNATLRNGVPVAGVWTISAAAGTLTSPNYNLVMQDGTLTVDKDILTVTASNVTMVTGSNVPIFTWSFSGLANGDFLSPDVYSGTPALTSPVTPMSDPGTYAITITQGTLSAPNYSFAFVNGTLTVKPDILTAASLAATAGTPQTATVNAAFATALQVTVYDQNNQIIPSAPVTFTAPASGASLAVTQIDTTADANGIATANVSANTVAGTYTVTAASGLAKITFQLTNKADVPAIVTATGGTPQTAAAGATFASALQARLTDRFNNPIAGTSITFTVVRQSNAGATFPNLNSSVTDSDGFASVTVRANSIGGTYTITATTGPITPAVFTLTNTAKTTMLLVPALLSGRANQFGLAWTNPLATPITLTITARGYDGQLISGSGIQNPAQLTIPAHAQFAKPTTEIFGAGITGLPGWIQLSASDSGGSGFFLLYDAGLSTADGGAIMDRQASRVLFPQVDSTTTLHVVNVGDQAIPSAVLFVYDNTGAIVGHATLPLPAHGGWTGKVRDVLPTLTAVDGYAIVDSQGTVFSTPSSTLAGMATYQRSGDNALLLAQDDSKALQNGYGVHIVSGDGYTSRLKLVNVDSVEQQVQLTLNGTTVTRTIPANGRLDEALDQTFNLSPSTLLSGYVSFQTSSNTDGVIGYLEVAGANGSLLTAEPLFSESEVSQTFSQVAQGAGFFTGMAILNPDPTVSANVTIEVDSTAGIAIESKVITLQAGQRFTGILTDLFSDLQTQLGGSIHIVATSPIFALEIFGSTGQAGSFFATIPPGNF